MPKPKVQIPDELFVNSRIRLIDSSWSFLFPDYWVVYRHYASRINVATLKVVEVLGNDQYLMEIMDVVPEEGRVRLPAGMKETCTLHQLQAAIALSYKYSIS